jgi:tetratricopeptide (TPR) repeat protein
MSTDNIVADVTEMYCASCGKSEVDDIKLKKCTACGLVRYCGLKCQRDHRSEHKSACKKRAAELRDEILFRQPESCHLGDCPICCLPLMFNMKDAMLQTCCSKVICKGCSHADMIREIQENRTQLTCPFCRHPKPTTVDEMKLYEMKRVAANDPVALRELGKESFQSGDYDKAFKYCTKAAKLGDVDAHYHLSFMYRNGQGVEKDLKKELYYFEEAAIGGHPRARCNLAFYEWKNNRFDRAVKHWIIAANLGYDEALHEIKNCYLMGRVSKDEFAAALRANQAAINESKSPQREAAANFIV